MIKEIHTYIRASRTSGADLLPHTALSFSRFPHITLPEVSIEADLVTTLKTRRSRKGGGRPLTLHDLGNLFGASMKLNHDGIHRPYPSGGGYYPIEAYFLGQLPNTTTTSVCHYEPETHVLQVLWKSPYPLRDFFTETKNDIFNSAIMLTLRTDEQSVKYNDFSYQLGLLEAGHIGQNLCLAATALDLHICSRGGYNDNTWTEVLDLQNRNEIPVYGFTLGK